MKIKNTLSQVLTVAGLILFPAGVVSTDASTIWTGSTINFTHSSATGELADTIVTNAVVITRGSGGGLYNSAREGGATSGTSPSDTKWAVGSLANYNTLSYGACPLEAGQFPPGKVGTTFVVHLVNEDIYFSLKLTAWGGEGGAGDKSFSYTRSTPAVVVAPTVTLTNPATGSVFSAPANLHLGASASVTSGTVTNVQFVTTTGTLLASAQSTPFTLTSGSLAAGSYSLEAIATAGGVSTTSAAVNVSVVTPVTVTLSGASSKSNQFKFNYTANSGLSYIVQDSSNLVAWTTLATNVAAASSVAFTNAGGSSGLMFYRVGLLPNP